MTRYREHNNYINAAIPYIFLYDDGGSQTIDDSYLTFDTIKSKTSHFVYEEDDDRIQLSVNSSGLFEVTFEVSLTGGASVTYFDVYKNGSVVEGARMYVSVYNPSQSNYDQSGSMTVLVFLQKDDYIQIKGTSPVGSPSTRADTMRLIVKALPMKGWDNDNSGRVMYRGGVLR
jgi:hypothetical protein